MTFAAQHLDGLRHVAMDLTHGARVWFDASFRFSSFEDAVSVATSRARLRAEHEKARKPHVRKKR